MKNAEIRKDRRGLCQAGKPPLLCPFLPLSYDMLKLLDGAIDLMRSKHYRGEGDYWILYYTYLSPQIIGSVDDIVESMRPHMKDVSRRTYYRKRREAIEILSSLLWGIQIVRPSIL